MTLLLRWPVVATEDHADYCFETLGILKQLNDTSTETTLILK